MIKFAIFDLDGTLLDSSEMWETLAARYLILLGKTPSETLSEELSRMTLRESAGYLRENYNIPYASEEIARHLYRMTEQFYTEEVRLKQGAPKLLAALRANCVHMSAATAGDERLEEQALSRLGVGDFFTGVVSCEKYGAKSSPEVFLAAAELIYALPEETLVFENSLFAVKTAKNAGFVTAAVADLSEKNQRQLKQTADFYAETLDEFADDIKAILEFEG